MNYPPYILLSPVGIHRSQHLNDFINAVKAFNPPPEKIVLCIDIDSGLNIKDKDIVVRINPEISELPSMLERICSAREILRNYFIYGPYELALWIDSDIIAPPELPRVLMEKMEEFKTLIIVNKYLGRNGINSRWCGSGVMLTHRLACTASRFWIGRIQTPQGEKHLSEDLVFFALFDQGSSWLNLYTGRSGRVCEEFVKVEHRLEKRERNV